MLILPTRGWMQGAYRENEHQSHKMPNSSENIFRTGIFLHVLGMASEADLRSLEERIAALEARISSASSTPS